MKFHRQRPVILYVEEVDFKPQLPEFGYRVTVVDIEITHDMARKIIEELQKKVTPESHGGIRFQLSGRMALP
jgi:hypothetical protein